MDYFSNYKTLIGCDEVGRGPIAGPVNGCAVSIEMENKKLLTILLEMGVTDSKKLTHKKRTLILEKLGIELNQIKMDHVYEIKFREYSFSFCISEHSPKVIDRINILQASLSCMKNACSVLVKNKTKILIDGNKIFELENIDTEAVVKGDSKSIVIGLASIIAKEYRDLLMTKLDKKYPGYGLARHAGYPTEFHREAVIKLGVTPIHRKTFKGVKEYL